MQSRTRFIVSAATLVAALFLSSCGGVAPVLSVDQGELGVYNALPLFTWSVAGSGTVKEAEYSLDGGVTWTPLAANVTGFRPDEPLDTGSYTLRLQYRTWSGWSDEAHVSFTVTDVAISEPDDTYYATEQWGLSMIDMPLLWGLLAVAFPGQQEVVVAVTDTGYLDHPDLIANVNTADGYDFISNVSIANDGNGIDPDAHDAGDDEGLGYGNSWHGTSVAGNIAAVSDNAAGVAGVARINVRIMPVRVLGVGGGLTSDIAQGVLYAAGLTNDSGTTPDDPAKIINMSLSGGGFDTFMETVLQQVRDAGVIVVAASGNDSNDPDWVPVGYPASSAYTIAAASVDASSEVSYYSQMGAEIDVVAPGGDAISDDWILLPSADPFQSYPPSTWVYSFLQGTSFACPHVAGALAVLCTIDPTIDLETARDLLKRSSSNLDEPAIPGLSDVGILNAASLVETHYGGRVASTVERPLFSAVPPPRPPDVGPAIVPQPPAQPIINEHTVDMGSLIVEYADSVSPAEMLLSGVPGVATVRGRGQSARVVELADGADLESTRQALLADPAVRAVHYNFRYYPQ
jgi:subtilisin family serine protease